MPAHSQISYCFIASPSPSFSAGFCIISSGCYHIFLSLHHFPMDFARFLLIVIMFSCSFYIHLHPLRGFSMYLFIFNVFSKSFTCLLHFPWFLHHFLWLLSHFPALSLNFSSIFTASSSFVPSIRFGVFHF